MKKRPVIFVGIGLIVTITAVIIGISIYANTREPGADPLSAESETAVETGPFDPAGRWSVTEGSQVGYRVDEVLNGKEVTVVGRTEDVNGEVVVEGTTIISADVEVDVASITTDSTARDEYFANTTMQVSKFPTASFILDTPVEVPDLTSGTGELNASGELTLADKTLPYGITFTIQRIAGELVITGNIPVQFSDFNIEAPNLGFVRVENQGKIEFSLRLIQ